MKRFKLLILTLLMVLTLLPFNTYADEDTTSEMLDYTVYANAGDLKSNEKYGSPLKYKARIIFGKDTEGNRLEWYLSGADNSLTDQNLFDNNILIISAAPIAKLQFNYSDNNSTYSYEANTGYGDTAGSIEVYANHYGNSELRENLQSTAENTSYFSKAEQNMMVSVPIITEDNKNKIDGKNIEYTTSDKLYIPSFKSDGSNTYLSYGSANGKEIELGRLDELFSTSKFFLRTPGMRGEFPRINMCTYDIDEGKHDYVIGTTDPDVLPVSVIVVADLKADNILFASAAETETAKIDKNKAMTLRFEDENLNIGKVVYTNDGVIIAEKGNNDKKVNLVVQGKNGEENWSYTKEITGNTVINKAEIIEELNKLSLNIADIDLQLCYIWLETTGDDGLIYATKSLVGISTVDITGIDAPVATQALDNSASCTSFGIQSQTPAVTWKPTDTEAGYFKEYTANVTLTAFSYREFIPGVSATVNGNPATDVTVNSDGTLTVTYTFPYTQDRLVSATNPDSITFENGISLENIFNGLPAEVDVTTVGNTTGMKLPVLWYKDPAISYNSNKESSQTFDVIGTVELPKDNSILPISNDGPATVTIKVNVSAKKVTANHTVIIPNTSVK